MKLLKVTVDRYKSITQASTITLDPRVTALVGKNEAGKTAVLEALYRINPLPSGHPTTFNELRDYPRRYRARDRNKIDRTYPSIMHFTLEADELAELEAKFGEGILVADHIKVTRGYGDETGIAWYDGQFDLLKLAGHRIKAAGLDVTRYLRDDLTSTAAALASDGDAAAAVTLSPTLTAEMLNAEVRTFLTARLPKFQYFDEYNVLPGSVSINRLQTTAESDLNPGERTALSLLRLAGVATEEFSEADYESRKASLEAAANQLTDEVFEYWTQNDQLEVELDIDFRLVPGHPAIREPWLEIRVKNNRHRVTLNMSDRSKGFIWFFSFLAAFSEYDYTFDVDGNETSTGTGLMGSAKRTSTWNNRDQNTANTIGAGSSLANTYLGAGNATPRTKQTSSGQNHQIRTSFTGITAVATSNGSTTTDITYVRRDPAGNIVAFTNLAGDTFYPLTDRMGSIWVVLDQSGGTVYEVGSYAPYGQPTVTITNTSYTSLFGYLGTYTNPATGLVHFSARYYDPTLGRFTQTDPSSQERNPYAYTDNDPINRVDLTGLDFWDAASFVLGIGAAFATGGTSLLLTGASMVVGAIGDYQDDGWSGVAEGALIGAAGFGVSRAAGAGAEALGAGSKGVWATEGITDVAAEGAAGCYDWC